MFHSTSTSKWSSKIISLRINESVNRLIAFVILVCIRNHNVDSNVKPRRFGSQKKVRFYMRLGFYHRTDTKPDRFVRTK